MVPCKLMLLLMVNACCSIGTSNKQNTLQFIFTIFRHGNRANDDFTTYPKDPYLNSSFYPYGISQLTNEGKMREYDLGKLLRKKYGKYLGMYVPSQVDAWSTNVSRTKMSLELVLASLYPPNKPLKWNKQLNWQPIPYNIEPTGEPKTSFPASTCKRYIKLFEVYLESDEGLKLQENYIPRFGYLQEHTGLKIKSIMNLFLLYSTLLTEEEYGYTLPKWTRKVYPTFLKNAAIDFYIISTATRELKKLSSGFLLKMLVDIISQKINGTISPPDEKILLYSGHEYNIAYLLRSLNMFYRHVPDYGSCIMIELHLINGIYGLKVFYQDWTSSEPKMLVIPGCTSFCPFEKFKEISSVYFPEDNDLCNKLD